MSKEKYHEGYTYRGGAGKDAKHDIPSKSLFDSYDRDAYEKGYGFREERESAYQGVGDLRSMPSIEAAIDSLRRSADLAEEALEERRATLREMTRVDARIARTQAQTARLLQRLAKE